MENAIVEVAAKKSILNIVKANPVKSGAALAVTAVAVAGLIYWTKKSKPVVAEELTKAEEAVAEEVLKAKAKANA